MGLPKILIVDDETSVRELLAFHLSRAGFATTEAADCGQARRMLIDERPDLVVMDWILPDMSGLELTRMIKRDARNDDLAVIVLTARSGEQDRLSALDGGADDYVTKPFSSQEIVARINAVLRRSARSSKDTIRRGMLYLDAAAHRVRVGKTEVHLGPIEYRLLKFLMSNPEKVYNRTQLLELVWGADVCVGERTVDVYVTRLRKSLAEFGVTDYLQTVQGAGYRFSVCMTNA